MPQQPGTYTATVDGQAMPDPDCDPSQGPCEMWIPGNYSVTYGQFLKFVKVFRLQLEVD